MYGYVAFILEANKRYNKVMRVINSCKTSKQLDSSENMLKNIAGNLTSELFNSAYSMILSKRAELLSNSMYKSNTIHGRITNASR